MLSEFIILRYTISSQIMSTRCWGFRRVARKGKELNVKFTPGVRLSFKNFAFEMVGYTLNQVSILVSWYVVLVLFYVVTVLQSAILTAGLEETALFQEYLVPKEYVQIMRETMLNRCPVSSYDQVLEVFKKELGGAPDEVSMLVIFK